LLFALPPELAHEGVKGLAWITLPLVRPAIAAACRYEHPMLWQQLWGMDIPNPVGLAAGLDKNARLLRLWSALGFGFVEIGSVTARPSRGNRRPRLFRLEQDGALINRLGLPNQGAARVARRLRHRADAPALGISIAKTHDTGIMGPDAVEDYRCSFSRLAELGSYIALNISCPNTADGKTFEEAGHLNELLEVLMSEKASLGSDIPVLIKLSPPDSPKVVYDSLLEDVLAVAMRHRIDGFVVCNTAPDRSGLETNAAEFGVGGMSGRPLHRRAVRMVQYIAQQTAGRVPIIGVGGIASAEDAYRMICAGASLLQLYTGLIYEGPGLVRRVKEGLVGLLQADGWASVADAVGSRSGDFSTRWPVQVQETA